MRPNLSEVGCSGIVYDDENLSDTFEVHDISIPLLPEIDAVSQELAKRPGAYFALRKVLTRDITLKLAINAESRCPVDIFEAWKGVSDKVAKNEPKPLYLNNDIYINAMLVGESNIELLGYRGAIELTVRAYDPFFYGQTHTETIGDTVTIEGGEYVYPTFTIKTTATTVKLTAPTGEVIQVDNLKSGATLIVDTEKQLCTVNGNYAPINIEVSDFFSLALGEQKVTITGGTGTFEYTERWL
jgi:phage-related protein